MQLRAKCGGFFAALRMTTFFISRRSPFDNSELQASAPWHFLYFFPEPHGQGSLRPTLSPARRFVAPLVSAEAALTERACSSSRCFFLWNSRSRASMVVDGARLDTGADMGWRAAGALVCAGGAPAGRALMTLPAA